MFEIFLTPIPREMYSMYYQRYVYSPTTCLFKCEFSYSCAAVEKISTDGASRGPSATAELFGAIVNVNRIRTDRATVVLRSQLER